MNSKGFTLIELMIVIAIIAIIAAIAIPGLMSSRLGSNETSTIGSLRAIYTAQMQFKSQKLVDENNSGTGEYGFLVELSGASAIRAPGNNTNPAVDPTFITPQFNADRSSKSGYMYTSYLCDNDAPGAFTWTHAAGDCDGGAQMNEIEFVVVAYPTVHGKTGGRMFAVDAQGTIMQCTNNTPGSFFDNSSPPDITDVFEADETGDFPESGEPAESGNTTWITLSG